MNRRMTPNPPKAKVAVLAAPAIAPWMMAASGLALALLWVVAGH